MKYPSSNPEVGRECRKLREAANVSQAAIAASLGFTPTYISMFERGEHCQERLPMGAHAAVRVHHLVEDAG